MTERDHSAGPEDAPVTLVEYGDYECPHCGAVHPIINQIQSSMGDRLRFVFRNFPLSTMHRHAMRAAEAAEAAGAQGRFWPMHDLLFENQQHLEDADLVADAKSIGADASRFQQDLASHRFLSHVQEDFRGAMRSGVKGTPAFFINGERYTGVYDLEPLLEVIRDAASRST
ncbi:MAG TPA: thioredoxin domain-containing protein [Tepidisphaeraceae bacterium]|nr:thioredoxin domain-containing protein [Tepidisphaeraceae bacterium]